MECTSSVDTTVESPVPDTVQSSETREEGKNVAARFRGSESTSERGSGRKSQQRTRLVVKDIEVENFKSYYGKHRIGPFHKTFTAVIGPNGSGKSNVIDSMLFVFGRNAKKIRLDKLSELIHNSAAHPNVTFSSVAVNFVRVLESEEDERRPEQRVEMVGSEFSIRREVFRSGASQYYIDDRRSTQKEVERRLITEGIDLEHNRFLILQGEVEQIALMKPKGEKEGEEGLLEYLDDLIGTNSLIAPIQNLTAEVEEAQTTRLEALAKERKLLLEREALDAAKNSAVDFVTKENQQKKTLIVMCQLRMQSTEESLVEPRKRLAEIDEKVKTYETQLEQLRKEKQAADEAFQASKKDVVEAAAMRDSIRQQKQTMEQKLEGLKSGAAEHERARKKMTDRVKKASDEAQKALLQQEDMERGAVIHESNLNEAREKVKVLQEQHDHLSATLLPQLRPLRQELEDRRRDFAPYEEAVAKAEEKVRTVKSKLTSLTTAEERNEQRLSSLESESQQDAEREVELQRQLKVAEASAEIEAQQRQLQDALREASRRKFAINNSIQEKKSSVREGEADDRAVDFLLSQRSLKGYYGTLRQLGRIDDMYDIAAGVASNAWGFHVVEDRGTASTALTLLKRENVGRASMMVIREIDREMQHRMNAPFQSPSPKAKRIFDLIKPTNEKFRSVFYQAVRDTLVVSTLSEAREVAFNSGSGRRYRVVTLKGELVEPSGFITGGGGVPRGAKLKAARSPMDRQTIMEELKKQQLELQHAVEEERAIQLRLQELAERSSSMLSFQQQKAMELELRRLSVRREDYERRRHTVEKEVTEARHGFHARREELVGVLRSAETELSEAQSRRDQEHTSLEKLEKAIEEAGGAAFGELSVSLKKEQERVEVEDSALRTCRRQQQKCRAAHERRLADVAEFQAALEKIDLEAVEGVKEQVASGRATLEELQRQLGKAQTVLSNAEHTAEECRAAVPVAQSRVLQCQKDLEEEQRYRQSEAAKMATAVQQLAKYEQKIDGCEETIKNNVEQYGVETLQLDEEEEEEEEEPQQQEEETNGGRNDGGENSDSARRTERHHNDNSQRAVTIKTEKRGGEEEQEGEETANEEADGTVKSPLVSERPQVNTNKKKGDRAGDGDDLSSSTSASEDEEDSDDEDEDEDDENEGDNEEEEEKERDRGRVGVKRGREGTQSGSGSRKKARRRVEKDRENGRASGAQTTGTGTKRGKAPLTVEQVRGMSFRLSPEALARCDYNRCRHLAASLLEELERLRGEIDLRAVTLWWERDAAHRKVKAAYLECKERSDKLEEELYELKKQRRERFMAVFTSIQAKIKEVYQMLTHGGDADLELVDANDPFEGVNFVVRPPRKPWRQISFLSGGEKTLSSLALIFSLHHIKPTPVYVMDEIDAALDFRNVSIVANYVLGQATGAQFIIISLRNNMFELAHQLVGVCKVNDITSTLVMVPRAFLDNMQHLFHRFLEARAEWRKRNEERRRLAPSQTATNSDRKRGRESGNEDPAAEGQEEHNHPLPQSSQQLSVPSEQFDAPHTHTHRGREEDDNANSTVNSTTDLDLHHHNDNGSNEPSTRLSTATFSTPPPSTRTSGGRSSGKSVRFSDQVA